MFCCSGQVLGAPVGSSRFTVSFKPSAFSLTFTGPQPQERQARAHGSWSLPCSMATRGDGAQGAGARTPASEDEVHVRTADFGLSSESSAEPLIPTGSTRKKVSGLRWTRSRGRRPQSLPVPRPAWGPPPPTAPAAIPAIPEPQENHLPQGGALGSQRV